MFRLAIKLALLLCAVLQCTFSSQVWAVTPEQAARETEIDGLQLGGRIGDIQIAYVTDDARPGNGKYVCGGMPSSEAGTASRAATRALDLIPGTVLARIRLRYLVLCSKVTASGQPIGGIPVPPFDLLMVAVGRDPGGVAHGVLHELYHFIEYRFGSLRDARWSEQFHGYANSYEGHLKSSPLGNARHGFVTSYAATFAYEDRAELFADLLLEPARLRASSDDIVQRKIAYLVKQCRTNLGWAPPW